MGGGKLDDIVFFALSYDKSAWKDFVSLPGAFDVAENDIQHPGFPHLMSEESGFLLILFSCGFFPENIKGMTCDPTKILPLTGGKVILEI